MCYGNIDSPKITEFIKKSVFFIFYNLKYKSKDHLILNPTKSLCFRIITET